MIPPRPAVIAHDKVLRVQKTAAAYDVADACPLLMSARLRHLACRDSFAMSLICAWYEAGRSRLETFRQTATIPILLWVVNRHRFLKRRLRAHRRRFARSPRFLNRAGLKIVGAADDLRNTLSGKTRNELIHT